MNMKFSLLLIASFLMVTIISAKEKKVIELPAIFSNNMVLQQNSNVPFWGKSIPALKIILKGSWGAEAKGSVNADSSWLVKIKTPKAGGPFNINVQIGDSSISYNNVLIGEVWLCSGQSNMEMPLEGWPPMNLINNSGQEIKDANYPQLRMFTVARAFSDLPEFNVTGTWSECTSNVAAKFSATAYFFGRKLLEELKIPIGLIHSSWGGTKAESWTSMKYLEKFDQFKDVVNKLEESRPHIIQLNKWLHKYPIIDVNAKDTKSKWKDLQFGDSDFSKPNFNDSNWHTMDLPRYWESTEVGSFDGVIWFRKKINIPKNWVGKELTLHLGPIDDMDITYVNGEKVGSYEEDGYYQMNRVYPVPANLIADTILTIAVRVLDDQGGGGIWGTKEQMFIQTKDTTSEKILLAGDWNYLPVADYVNSMFYVFGANGNEYFDRPKLPIDLSADTPSSLYNGMIAPLIPYSIKGVIWYQGEANVGAADFYKKLFPTLIQNWRDDWKEGNFPFYYVQIAPWQYAPGSASQKIREAQMQSLSVPNSGMAVTLDIGDANSIHPGDKQDVGKRLALWALAKTYNKKLVYSGPIYKSMKVVKNKIVLSFKYADGGLVIKSQNSNDNFLIAGEDKVFKNANVKVEGSKLIVSSPEITKPIAVRYGWSDYVDGSLFNKAGLPASSFRTDDWDN